MSVFLAGAAAEEALPKEVGVDRYESLWRRSPFDLPSSDSATGPVPSQGLYLSGVMRVGEEEFVTIVDRATEQTFLVGREANAQGWSLVTMQRSDDATKVSATVRRGDEAISVRFDSTRVLASAGLPLGGAGTGTAGIAPDATPRRLNPALISPPPAPVRVRRSTPIPSTPPPHRRT